MTQPRRRFSQPHSNMRDQYDVVIVGSGYGGSVTAARLSAWNKDGDKKSVCLLKRGKEWIGGDFPESSFGVLRSLRWKMNPHGLYDFRFNGEIDVVAGSGLGSTSLINASVMLRPEPRVFEEKPWPKQLPDLEPYFKKAVKSLYAIPNPEPPLKAAVFSEAASETENVTSVERLDIAVTFEKTGREKEDVIQEACDDCGDCVGGCRIGAKNSLDMNYLALAEKQGTAMFTSMEVRSIEKLAHGLLRVHYRDLEEKGHGHVDARQVILSAGTLGSYAILQRSKDKHGLYVSNELGSRFSGNADILGFGHNLTRKTNVVEGPTINTAAIFRESQELDDHFFVVDGGVPKALVPVTIFMLLVLRPLARSTGGGFVNSVRKCLRHIADLVFLRSFGALNRSLLYLSNGFENDFGRLVLKRDRVRVRWPGVQDQKFVKTINKKMREITSKLSGTYYTNPRWSRLFGHNLVTVHPLGGCVMADDDTKGVVNYKGEVFGHKGSLYVVDGSIVVPPLGVNPALTISALAEWCGEKIIESWSASPS